VSTTVVALSNADKLIAVKYLTSSSYPDIVNACSAKFPEKGEIYKATLDKWLEANNFAISRGKLIFEAQTKAESPEKNPDEIIKEFKQMVSIDFSGLSDAIKAQRCSFILETMKNEQ
jgi:hypothetical protein